MFAAVGLEGGLVDGRRIAGCLSGLGAIAIWELAKLSIGLPAEIAEVGASRAVVVSLQYTSQLGCKPSMTIKSAKAQAGRRSDH